LEAEGFLQGKTVRCGDLCQGKPGLTAFFEHDGVGPDTLLTLSVDFVLAIQSEGMHRVSHGSATIGGKPVPLLMHNEMLIGLQ
jgi:hypothetical protein